MKRAHQPGQIITPRNPLPGRSTLAWARDITKAVQQLRDRKVYYSPGSVSGGSASKAARISWRLSVAFDDPDWKWQVSAARSTITDGTNGDHIDLGSASTEWATGAIKFDTPTPITGDHFIVLNAVVTPATMVIDDFTFAAVPVATPDDTKEIDLDDNPVEQVGLRLLIGKIEFTGDPSTPKAIQGETRPQFVDFGFFDGVAVRNFIPPPVVAASLA